jgi:hypothetical protein
MPHARPRLRPIVRTSAGLAFAAVMLSAAGPTTAQQAEPVVLGPDRAGTAHQHRCASAVLSTGGTECQGFAGREILSDPGLFVVGYENDKDVSEKHAYQAVVVFDLAALRTDRGDAALSKATLGYGEGSTARRSPSGESEYGILPTCNTALGVPADNWDGSLDKLVPTRPAAVAGVAGATTGGSGGWDVTPQVQQWLAGSTPRGVLVLRGDDESMDVKGMAMCLSYVSDLGLAAEFAPRP